MRHLLEKLRNQPEENRKAVALTASLALTGVIFFLWFVGAARDFNGTMVLGDTVYQSAASAAASGDSSPFSAFGERIGTALEGFRNQMSDVMGQAGGFNTGGVEYERAE